MWCGAEWWHTCNILYYIHVFSDLYSIINHLLISKNYYNLRKQESIWFQELRISIRLEEIEGGNELLVRIRLRRRKKSVGPARATAIMWVCEIGWNGRRCGSKLKNGKYNVAIHYVCTLVTQNISVRNWATGTLHSRYFHYRYNLGLLHGHFWQMTT